MVVDITKLPRTSPYQNYIPERDYFSRGYEPVHAPFPDMCGGCKAYYKMMYEKGYCDSPFPPNCAGHILDGVKDLNVDDFDSEEEYEDAITLLDPIAWAQYKLGWIPRWYQEEVLSCTSQFRILRAGRRCLAKGTMVATTKGPTAIEDIKPGDKVFDENGQPITVKDTFYNGPQEVIDLSNNGTLMATCTNNHQWLSVYRGGKHCRKTSELYKGVGIVREEVKFEGGDKQVDHAYVLGALIGDGCSKQGGLCISSNDEKVVTKIAKILNAKPTKAKNNFTWYFSKGSHTHSIKPEIYKYEEWVHNKYAHEKTCDIEEIKTWNRNSQLEFLAGLIDTDGSVIDHGNEISIQLNMQAKDVIEAARYIILSMWGISPKINVDSRKKYKNGPVYYLHIKHIYNCKRILKDLTPYLMCDRKKYNKKYDEYIPNNFNPKKVGVSKSNPRVMETYDIHVDSPTNLYMLANGLVTHNSGKSESMMVNALHHVDTNSNHNVIVLAPYEAQVQNLFDIIKKLITESPNQELAKTIVRDTKSPFRLEFANGSKILGFSSGSKTAARSDKIRGFDAHVIIIDEMDYIADEDLDAVTAILASHKNCQLWVASTPSGEHGKFFGYSVDKNHGFKEFWVLAHESPNYDEKTDAWFKRDYTLDKYQHEILADFGEQTQGVFLNSLVDAAIQDYSLKEMGPITGGRYALGVDWNKTDGTHMVIVEDLGEAFKLVKKIVIPKSEFIQSEAVEKIIELYHSWNLKGVYVDAGYGTMQIETLKRWSISNNSFLHRRLTPFTMNQKIDVRDPGTGRWIKKDTKPFLVNTVARELEEGRLILPREEDTVSIATDASQGVVQQMRNFKVEGYSVHGLPKYSQGQDHTLTALLVAIGGYILDFGNARKIDYSTDVGIAGQFGEQPDDKDVPSPTTAELNQKLKETERGIDKGSPLMGYARDLKSIFQQQKNRNNPNRKSFGGGGSRGLGYGGRNSF